MDAYNKILIIKNSYIQIDSLVKVCSRKEFSTKIELLRNQLLLKLVHTKVYYFLLTYIQRSLREMTDIVNASNS